MTLTHPLALLLLLVAPLAIALAVLARRKASQTVAGRGWTVLRRHWVVMLALVLGAVGLAEPVVETVSRERVLVIVVDRSGSIATRAVDGALTDMLVAEVLSAIAVDTNANAPEWSARDTLAVIDVGERARVLRAAAPLGETTVEAALREAIQATAAGDANAGTDLVGAIDAALSQIPTNSAGAMVVITDGRDTRATDAEPALAGAIARARARGITIAARSPSPRNPPDVRLGEPTAPLRVAAGEPVTVRVPLIATHASSVRVQVRALAGNTVLEARMRVWRGSVALPHMENGAHALEANALHSVTVELEAPTTSGLVRVDIDVIAIDSCPQNNAVSTGFFVRDQPRALIVTPAAADDASPLRTSLHALLDLALPQWELVWTPPTAAPTSVRDFADYDLVVNAVAPRRAWPPASFDAFDRAVADATRQLGIAYAMIGGPDSFGPGGYIGTQQDAILPVDCDPNRERPAAVAFALDCSDSMAPPDGTSKKLTRATSAARELLNQLVDGRDAVGVLPFAVSQLDTLAMQPLTAERRVALEAALTRIASRNIGGGLGQRTDIASALVTALDWLEARPEEVHVAFVLSDGNPTEGIVNADDPALQRVIDRIREAGIYVHLLIAAGRDESAEFFTRLTDRINRDGDALASTTVVTDTLRLPATALEQFARSKGPLERHADNAAGFGLVDSARLPLAVPPIAGYARTKLKPVGSPIAWAWFDDAGAGAADGADEPFLATWRVGNGRALAAMLPLEAGNSWLGAWAREGVPPAVTGMLVDALRDTARADRAGNVPWDVSIEPVADVVRVVAQLRDAEAGGVDAPTRARWLRDGLELELLLANDQQATTARLRAVTPGRFEVALRDLPPGEVVLGRLTPADGNTSTVDRFALATPRAAEWARVDTDEAALRMLNAASRDAAVDAVLPPIDANADADASASDAVRLAPWLFLAIALVVLLDVGRSALLRGRSGLSKPTR